MPIRLLLGRTRSRRLAVLRDRAQLDAVGRPDLLYVTDSQRKRDQALQDFEAMPSFQPQVHVIGELLSALWHRYGDGRAVLEPQALELAARFLLDQHGPDWLLPTHNLAMRGPALAAQLAALEQGLAHHDEAASIEPRIERAVKALRRHLGQRRWHIRPTEAWNRLRALLERPSAPLLAWLRSHALVVIDDVLRCTPLEARMLVSLSRALSYAGVEVIVSFASGWDRGGREAGVLFGWDPPTDPRVAHELRTFGASHRLRTAAFELVATGEATIEVATHAGLFEVEPWSDPAPAAPMDLADHLATGARLPIESAAEAHRWLGEGAIRLVQYPDPSDEAYAVAQDVKAALLDGADPADCMIAVAGLANNRVLLEGALQDCGVPFAIGGGTPLAWLPVVRAARSALEIAVKGPCPLWVCGLAERIRWELPLDSRVVRRALNQAGIPSTPDPATDPEDVRTAWREAVEGWLVRNQVDDEFAQAMVDSVDRLAELCRACRPLGVPADPLSWQSTVINGLDGLGLPASCDGDPDQLHAWAKLVEVVERFAADLHAVHDGTWPPATVLEQLTRALERANVPSLPRSVARVPVTGVRELQGVSPRHVWVLGLNRGAFPQRPGLAFLLNADLRRKLEPDTMAEGRAVLASLLREALANPGSATVSLSWPASRQGRAVPPSPLLAEILDAPTAEGPLSDHAVTHGVGPSRPGSTSAAIRLMAHDDAWCEVMPTDLAAEFACQAAAVRDRTGRLGPRDGLLRRAPRAPAVLSVTALEAFMRCPQRYWYDRVLGLQSTDAWAPELEPRRRGTALHEILERFVEQRGMRALAGGDPRVLGPELAAVAAAVLDEVELQGGFDPAFQAYARTRWLAGLTDDAPAGILRAWLDKEIAATTGAVPLAVEKPFNNLRIGPIRLRGVLDRLDRLPSGALVVTDYKTGAAPTRRAVAEGLALQPYAYAEAARRMHPDTPVVSSFLSLAKPDRLRHTGWVGDAEAIDEACTPTQRRTAVVVDDAERAEVLGRAAEHAKELIAGRFPTTRISPDDAGCASCPHARVCRRREPEPPASEDRS
ncbi:MAG: PD-(D/E)XK nuclease family protein [Myxococcales bacterium]|nr:PD-(D/E)XK nuclease family protein [Myxococcales bacterium]